MGKMGIFSILKIESLFPSLSIYFFPIFAHPQIQISVCLGEKWGWTPHLSTVYIHTPLSVSQHTPTLSLSLPLYIHTLSLPLYIHILSSYLYTYTPSLCLSTYTFSSTYTFISFILPQFYLLPIVYCL